MILDLRGNGGGCYRLKQSVAGVWLNDKDVVSEKGKSNNPKTLNRKEAGYFKWVVPTVVLIDSKLC